MDTKWARTARGSIAAAFATFVAVFSHVLGGGAMPQPAAIALTLSLALLLCVGFTARRMSLWRTALSVAASQFIFHSLFSEVGTTGVSTAVSPGTMVGHPDVRLMADMSSASTQSPHDGWMWLAHALAAIITIAAIRYGERAFWSTIALAGLVIRRLLATTITVRPSVVAVPRASRERTLLPIELGVLISVMRHRGPPAPLPFA